MREKTCCFTGHRHIPPEELDGIRERLEATIKMLYNRGVRYYGAGGALGFDTLAAETVLRLRDNSYPHLWLILVLPCRDQARGWNTEDVESLLESGFLDVYRHLYPKQAGAYTWWSHRFHKREPGDGWRMDIHLSWQSTQPYEKGQIRQKRPMIDFPDEYLGELWEQTDWDAAEETLTNLQRELAQAACRKDMERVTSMQKRLVRLPICNSWLCAECALAAPGRDRMMGLPTFFDRAMQVLYGFSLLPVLETWGDRKSFAFREGRSMQDCHVHIVQILQGRDALELLLLADVQAYYSHIQHGWMLESVPMDKKVLGVRTP